MKKKPKILTKDLLTEIDNLVEDIQIKGVLSQKQKINSVGDERRKFRGQLVR